MFLAELFLVESNLNTLWILYRPEFIKLYNSYHTSFVDDRPDLYFKEIWVNFIHRIDPSTDYKFAKWATKQLINKNISFSDIDSVRSNLEKYIELSSEGKITRKNNIEYLDAHALDTLVNSNETLDNPNTSYYYEDNQLLISRITNYTEFVNNKPNYWSIPQNQFDQLILSGPIYIITLKNNNNKYFFHFGTRNFRDKDNNFVGIDYISILANRYTGLNSVFKNEFQQLHIQAA